MTGASSLALVMVIFALAVAVIGVTGSVRQGFKDLAAVLRLALPRSLEPPKPSEARVFGRASAPSASVMRAHPMARVLTAEKRAEWEWHPTQPCVFEGVEVSVVSGRPESVMVGQVSQNHVVLLLREHNPLLPAAWFNAQHPRFPRCEWIVDPSTSIFADLVSAEDALVVVTPLTRPLPSDA